MIHVGIECRSIEEKQWGVGRIVAKLLEEIARRPELVTTHRFHLYFKNKIPDLAYLDNPIFIKKIVRLPAGLPTFYVVYYFLLLPIRLWFEKLDVMFWPNYMLPILARGCSLVTLTEDVYYEARQGQMPWHTKLAYRIFAGWSARYASKIIADTYASKAEVARLFGISPSRIAVDELGTDIVPTDNGEATSAKGDYMMYVGQAFPRRHLKETLLAFQLIAPKFQNLRLVAIGADRYNPPIIKQLVTDINQVLGREATVYKEYVTDAELIEYYKGARALIYISYREAFGIPPVEALGYGTVPIVAPTAITHEIFGDNAFFNEEPHSVESIARVLERALTDTAKQGSILEAAPAILKKYTWKAHTDRFLNIVKDVITSDRLS